LYVTVFDGGRRCYYVRQVTLLLSSLLILTACSYLGDGRFHLESIMISNPTVPAFRYDPYSKKFTRERYNHTEMRSIRYEAVRAARRSIDTFASPPVQDVVTRPLQQEPPLWGVVLGTLGRQGSFKQLQAIMHQLSLSRTPIPFMPILLSELSPAKLALFNPYISTFVQTSCPRLSIDWGYAFDKPLLSPYETAVAVGKAVGWIEEDNGKRKESRYPMDFYTANTPWAISRTRAMY
jgi:2-(3-amino-3-carboxypropyl)histidine synthase